MASSQALRFDPHCFAGRKSFPVHAHLESHAQELVTTGIGFDDYFRMQTLHRGVVHRRVPAPLWVRNKEQFQAVLVRMMERRVGIHHPPAGATLPERLAAGTAALREQRPRLIARLDMLCARRQAEKDPDRRRRLAIEIEGLDTILVVGERWAAVIARVAYLSWCVQLDSPGVALEAQLKPPLIRQLLHRLRQEARRLGFEDGIVQPVTPRASLKTCKGCGVQFRSLRSSGKVYCGRECRIRKP